MKLLSCVSLPHFLLSNTLRHRAGSSWRDGDSDQKGQAGVNVL